MKQISRFAAVGSLGFAVDFAALYVLVFLFGLGNFSGRVLSFIVAATVTWCANRHFTFQSAKTGAFRQWIQYLLATSIGGAINVGVYQLWVRATDESAGNLFIGVVLGSGVAMFFNFAISKRVIFAA